MAEDARVNDGARSRPRRACNNSAKTGKKEVRAAGEHPEEMQQHVDGAQERACESERCLCRELEEGMYSWEREFGRPRLSTKIWQMMQSKNTKFDHLESDFTEILEKTHLRRWNATAKSIRG